MAETNHATIRIDLSAVGKVSFVGLAGMIVKYGDMKTFDFERVDAYDRAQVCLAVRGEIDTTRFDNGAVLVANAMHKKRVPIVLFDDAENEYRFLYDAAFLDKSDRKRVFGDKIANVKAAMRAIVKRLDRSNDVTRIDEQSVDDFISATAKFQKVLSESGDEATT